MQFNISEALRQRGKIKLVISHFRVNGTRKRLQTPIEVELAGMYWLSGSHCEYSGIHRINTYLFRDEDIFSTTEHIQPDSNTSGGHSQEGYLGDLLPAQKHMDANLDHLTANIAALAVQYQGIQYENKHLSAIVSDLAKGIEEQSKQITAIQQQLQAQQAPIPRKSFFSFFSSQTK